MKKPGSSPTKGLVGGGVNVPWIFGSRVILPDVPQYIRGYQYVVTISRPGGTNLVEHPGVLDGVDMRSVTLCPERTR